MPFFARYFHPSAGNHFSNGDCFMLPIEILFDSLCFSSAHSLQKYSRFFLLNAKINVSRVQKEKSLKNKLFYLVIFIVKVFVSVCVSECAPNRLSFVASSLGFSVW